MTVPRLEDATVRAYLTRLGLTTWSLDVPGLTSLLRAHLLALPLHNLGWFASEESPRGRLTLESAVEGNIAGLGGTGDALMPPFVALLHSLGFEAWLARAKHHDADGDSHWVGIVRFPRGLFLVDAGAVHPLPEPLPLDSGPSRLVSFGEVFRVERTGDTRYRLCRMRPDGTFREEYHFTPEPSPHEARKSPSGAHPVLDSLRVVRASRWVLASIHDAHYRRFAGGLETRRPILEWGSLAALLHTTMGLPEELIARALHGLRRRRPDLLAAAEHARRPPRFLLSMAVTGRTEGARTLLQSVNETLEREQRPKDSVGVLVLDNERTGARTGALEPLLEEFRRSGLQVALVEARQELARLEPSQRWGLLPTEIPPPLPIGATRTLQTSLLHEHLRTGMLELPHPGDGQGPIAVWMLDDDLAFQRLSETPEGFEVEPGRELFSRAEWLWSHHPEVSVALGSFTGEPPIPGYATLHVQTQDLAGNLRALAEREPQSPWVPSPSPRELPDYYYDHARGSTAHLQTVFAWVPPGRAPWCVRDAFRTLCAAFTQVIHGQQVTRPLTHRPSGSLAPGRNRGGNALFFDLDALVASPYPVLRGEEGIMTRRADTLWAHLLAREPLIRLVQAALDLRHGRAREDGSSPLSAERPDPVALRGFVEGQERGVILARLLEHAGAAVDVDRAGQEVRLRREALAHGREGARRAVAEARRVLNLPDAWWWRWEPDRASARTCLAALLQVEVLIGAVDALEDPRLPEQLEGFARRVTENLTEWRATWG